MINIFIINLYSFPVYLFIYLFACLYVYFVLKSCSMTMHMRNSTSKLVIIIFNLTQILYYIYDEYLYYKNGIIFTKLQFII